MAEAITKEDFERELAADAALSGPITRAYAHVPRSRTGVVEVTVIALMFPVAQYLVTAIGLPWLYEAARYADLWRQKFGAWVDEQYRVNGLDPQKATAAGEALRKELQATTDAASRKSWERLHDLMRPSSTGGSHQGSTEETSAEGQHEE